MKPNRPTVAARDASPAVLAAELTDVAYAVALRHGVSGWWIDLQLDLWAMLAQAVDRAESPSAGSLDGIETWREGLLADTTAVAYRTALRHGLRGPFPEVGRGLYQALRPVVTCAGEASS
jgi:hypothetical protein